ncbi:hypothetical protein BSN85_37465 [Bradyrhizobium brasilense]|nr:hypothetical protein BSN85_37465 [Bradyrhizobium brasilense]
MADAVCRACAGQARSLPRTGATMQRSRAVFITAIVYALIGLVLAGGGIWLAALALLWQIVDFAAFYRIPESIFQ